MTEQENATLPAKDVLENAFNNSLGKFVCAPFPNDFTKENIRKLGNHLSVYEKELANKQAKKDSIK